MSSVGKIWVEVGRLGKGHLGMELVLDFLHLVTAPLSARGRSCRQNPCSSCWSEH